MQEQISANPDREKVDRYINRILEILTTVDIQNKRAWKPGAFELWEAYFFARRSHNDFVPNTAGAELMAELSRIALSRAYERKQDDRNHTIVTSDIFDAIILFELIDGFNDGMNELFKTIISLDITQL